MTPKKKNSDRIPLARWHALFTVHVAVLRSGERLPDGPERDRLHLQHHGHRRQPLLLHLPLLLLQPPVQLPQHAALGGLNLAAGRGGHRAQPLCGLAALRPARLLLHLRPERQQLLHGGRGGGALPGAHRRGHLLLPAHLDPRHSGQLGFFFFC